MKRTHSLLLVAALLVCTLLFTACGASSVTIKSLLSAPKNAEPVYPTSATALSTLSGMSIEAQQNQLVYLVSENDSFDQTHMIYDLVADQVVFSKTEGENTDIEVTLASAGGVNGYPYFTVTTRVESEFVSTFSLALYDQFGTKAAEVTDANASYFTAYDLICMDGKCYSFDKTGAIVYSFDYSPLAKQPSISFAVGGYYYEYDAGDFFAIYNASLQPVSRFVIPDYAEGFHYAYLPGGNILIQYSYEELEDATDYTYVNEGTKYTLVTAIVDKKSGNAKAVDCPYLFTELATVFVYADRYADMGANLKNLAASGYGYEIEAQGIEIEGQTRHMLCVNKDGGIAPLDTLKGERLSNFPTYIGGGIWAASTESHIYLIDKNGAVKHDVSSAAVQGSMLNADGKLYDENLTMLYNFGEGGYSIESSFAQSVLLKGEDGAVAIYDKVGGLTTLIPAGETSRSIMSTGSKFIVVSDYTTNSLTLYTPQGSLLLTINNDLNSGINRTISYEDVTLIQTRDSMGQSIFYRLTASVSAEA